METPFPTGLSTGAVDNAYALFSQLKLRHYDATYKTMTEENPTSEMEGVAAIRFALQDLPAAPGVYRMLSEEGEVLYVGKARALKNRVSSYANIAQLPRRLQRMVAATRKMEFTLTASEAEALLLEATLIKSHQPRYNILLKDDKSYPYVRFCNHEFPRIEKYRGSRKDKGEYFGPYVSAGAVDETLALLQKAFLLRICPDSIFKHRTRPCLQYQIKRCSAPCVGYVSKEEYGQLLAEARSFMRGQGDAIQKQLAKEMEEAAEAMDYERASVLRDRLKALAHMRQSGQSLNLGSDTDMFALAQQGEAACVQVFCYRNGRNCGNRAFFPARTDETAPGETLALFAAQYYQRESPPARVLLSHLPEDSDVLAQALSILAKRKVEIAQPQRGSGHTLMQQALANARAALTAHLHASMREQELLEAVAKLFGLTAPPERIEVYDNSHVSGTNAVGAMIVAGAEGLTKSAYRVFNIKSETLTPGDDYAMLREVLTRRFKRLLEEEAADNKPIHPDIVLIDGGVGQLSAAEKVLEELGISGLCLVSIAKGPDRNAGREWFHIPGRPPFQLEAGTPVLHYLQRLRDEAHRFAIGAHRNRRSKAAHVSELDAISGIGGARKKALLNHFGSTKGVASASVAELQAITGINRALAEKIHGHFRG